MIPASQVRAVDPFSSYHSDNVNRLTRMVTSGTDAIMQDPHLLPTKLSNTQIRISSGLCIMSDVLIQTTSNETIDVTDSDNYVEGSLFSGPFPAYGYLVLTYQYVKQPVAPTASLLILKTLANLDDTMLFLGMAKFSDVLVVDQVLPYDHISVPNVERNVLNFAGGYTDADARAADSLNPITNHMPAAVIDYNKLVATNSTTGAIELISKSGLVNNELEIVPADYTGNEVTITHNFGIRPKVQVIEFASGEQRIPEDVIHINNNSFKLVFDAIVDPNPHILVLF